jgi:hypothetical protein
MIFLGIDVYLKGSDFERNNNSGRQQVTNMIISNLDIKHVLMFALGPAYISGRTHYVFELIGKPEVKAPLQILDSGLRHTLTAMVATGKKVTVVLKNPELIFDPRRCLSREFSLTIQS